MTTHKVNNHSYSHIEIKTPHNANDNVVSINNLYIVKSVNADLAEYYEADQKYEPGTVLEFGGDNEVTLATDGTNRVAGVVSTYPAYAMNANCKGIATAIALQGRVPCKVIGPVAKGDLMVSAGFGYAKTNNNPAVGQVLGKSLADFSGAKGVIEVVIGRF